MTENAQNQPLTALLSPMKMRKGRRSFINSDLVLALFKQGVAVNSIPTVLAKQGIVSPTSGKPFSISGVYAKLLKHPEFRKLVEEHAAREKAVQDKSAKLLLKLTKSPKKKK